MAGIVIIELLVNRPDLFDWARPTPGAPEESGGGEQESKFHMNPK